MNVLPTILLRRNKVKNIRKLLPYNIHTYIHPTIHSRSDIYPVEIGFSQRSAGNGYTVVGKGDALLDGIELKGFGIYRPD